MSDEDVYFKKVKADNLADLDSHSFAKRSKHILALAIPSSIYNML